MGELEPNDSRDVTLSDERAPGEPPRTGPREGETRGQHQSQSQWRSDAQGRTQGQDQTNESNWRAAEAGREAQDHDKAGGIDGPSPRADAPDGQWSQQPEVDYEATTQPMSYLDESQLGRAGHGGVDRESDLKLGTELRGARDAMAGSDTERQREQAERGGG